MPKKRVEQTTTPEEGQVPAELLFELTPLVALLLLLPKVLAFPEPSPVRAANNPAAQKDKHAHHHTDVSSIYI